MAARESGESCSSARRRREWRHEQLAVKMAVSCAVHHSSQRSFVDAGVQTVEFFHMSDDDGDVAVERADGGGVAPQGTVSLRLPLAPSSRQRGHDASALVFLVSRAVVDRKKEEEEEKVKEETRMERIEDMLCEGAPVSRADVAAWRRLATRAKRKRKKRRKKKLPRSGPLPPLPHAGALHHGGRAHRLCPGCGVRRWFTGRIIYDTYGGWDAHGRGAYSGKEPARWTGLLLYGVRAHLFFQPSGKFFVGGPQRDAGLAARTSYIATYGVWGVHHGAFSPAQNPLGGQVCCSHLQS